MSDSKLNIVASPEEIKEWFDELLDRTFITKTDVLALKVKIFYGKDAWTD